MARWVGKMYKKEPVPSKDTTPFQLRIQVAVLIKKNLIVRYDFKDSII